MSPSHPLSTQLVAPAWRLGLLILLLAACAGQPIPTQSPQAPDDYLARAMDWLEANAVKHDRQDWAALRRQAQALAPNPQTTADTYASLSFLADQNADDVSFFLTPAQVQSGGNFGLMVHVPQNIILEIDPGGPAERAGLRVGDTIVAVDGALPRPWHRTVVVDLGDGPTVQLTIRRANAGPDLSVTLGRDAADIERDPNGRRLGVAGNAIGYLELPQTHGDLAYATKAQRALREADQAAVCGWVVDLRRTFGGDIWSYLAAVGPILGEGEVGGFTYGDGTREPWAYQGGKVYWNGNERSESLVEGPLFQPRPAQPPVALLTSPATSAAGELAVVAFQGRPKVRRFGEPTAGSPFLQFHTALSDGAFLSVSGAFGTDRSGHIYDGPIAPDEAVATDWNQVGTDQDPVLKAATDWLQGLPECAARS